MTPYWSNAWSTLTIRELAFKCLGRKHAITRIAMMKRQRRDPRDVRYLDREQFDSCVGQNEEATRQAASRAPTYRG